MRKIDRIVYDGMLPESFFTIPGKIYASLPFNVTENTATVHELFLTEYSEKEIIIYTDHENLRLVGIFDPKNDEPYFGFWETTDDLALNKAAFELLHQDVLARNSKKITGPINFNTFNAYRLRTGKVPEWVQFDKEPVNPPYYETLLQSLDFSEAYTYESRMIHIQDIPSVYINKQVLLEGIMQLPFKIVPINENSWIKYEDEIYALVLNVFAQNPGFRTIGKTAFLKMFNRTYAKGLCPHSSVLFFDRETDKPVAMSFCHPNYTSLNLPPTTPPDFSRDYKKLERKILLAKTIGVHPGYRQQGLMNYLGAYGMLSFQQYYHEVIFCLMREGNYSLQFTDGLKYEAANYALYQKNF
ncbi:MAG: hypothetical protein QM802_12585 [Agriterribacter sp.]